MSSQTKSTMMRKGAQVVATELLKEPVKQAVREALHEEAASVSPESGGQKSSSQSGQSQTGQSQQKSQQSQEGSSSGGRSKLTMMGLVVVIAGVTYLARKRMSSTSGSAWSEPSPGAVATDDAESGYVSEGEMQTAETADKGGSGTSGSSSSSSK